MPSQDPIKPLQLVISALMALIWVVVSLLIISLIVLKNPQLSQWDKQEPQTPRTNSSESAEIVNGIHTPTGLIADESLPLIIQNCTNCHSAKMITQNRATREGWLSMIRWMQSTQNLWDLGENESAIIDYLAKNYAPEKEGRRKNLANIEWYALP